MSKSTVKNLVNLNVNPCKMCMPMGSVSAFCGIKGSMTILHGSQGCSTYIRRHMATHYNEPVDIASSSLTEEGTVFGGEKNLVKGLENLIKLYNPAVIGVSTTCLAETIGEDVPRIIQNFYRSHPDVDAKIVNVASAGYSGTQYEGFFRALRAVVEQVEMDSTPNGRVNIVTGMLSPADTRWLKRLLSDMGLDYILLPDLSDNLDGPHVETYDRLPGGGTALEDIALMAGAKLTIELSAFIREEASPARYLYDTYGVPFVRCRLPVGLRDTDAFLSELEAAGGVQTEEMRKERGRYLDAMVDSHKYNAEGRAVVFGEPDFVDSIVRLCVENGILPLVTATGSKSPELPGLLEPEIRKVADLYFIEDFKILDDCDFDTIERWAQALGANIMLGSSDGRRVAEHLDLPLVRCAYPIHDHVGGQRVRMLGFEGSLTLLDRVTNELLSRKESSFREELYDAYYQPPVPEARPVPEAPEVPAAQALSPEERRAAEIAAKTATHPCFSGCGSGYARMHLPIAPKCNIQCNYCVRKFDCPNESRPGVTTEVLSPEDAAAKYQIVKAKLPNLKVVGIAGPGDSLAEFEKTKKTLELIRAGDPEVTFCLSTNGLLLPFYADELVALGVSHVTVTMNAVDPAVGAKIYKHIDYMGERYTGEAGAALLLANQLAGIQRLTTLGIVCKINIVMLKGVNDTHIPKVVERAKALGCQITNIMQLIPVKGSAFETMPLVSNKEMMEMRKMCESTMPQMYHCRQCRADAIGTLDNDQSIEFRGCRAGIAPKEEKPEAEALGLLFAVSSKGGVLVDQHFGHATDFYIYEYKNGDIRFKERRSVSKYCDGPSECDGAGGGSKEGKMESILAAVGDCAGVLSLRIGEAPKQKLSALGIRTFVTYDRIEDAVRQAVAEYNLLNKSGA